MQYKFFEPIFRALKIHRKDSIKIHKLVSTSSLAHNDKEEVLKVSRKYIVYLLRYLVFVQNNKPKSPNSNLLKKLKSINLCSV